MIKQQSTFKSEQIKVWYQIRNGMNCDSKHIIYQIHYNRCKICQTNQRFVDNSWCPKRLRLSEDLFVSKHFDLPVHSVDKLFESIYFVGTDTDFGNGRGTRRISRNTDSNIKTCVQFEQRSGKTNGEKKCLTGSIRLLLVSIRFFSYPHTDWLA